MAKEKVFMLDETRKQEVIDLCEALICARSYSGEEKQVAEIMRDYSEKAGFDSVAMDRYGNCVCRIKGNRPGPRLLFDGHMDTVPVPDPTVWKHDPFKAEIRTADVRPGNVRYEGRESRRC